VEKGGYSRPEPLAFTSWSATRFEQGQKRRAWKPATVTRYRKVLEYLDEYFGQTRLDAIRPRDVSEYIAEYHGRFCARYVNLHVNVLHDTFKMAVTQELIGSNPVSGVEPPKVARPAGASWSHTRCHGSGRPSRTTGYAECS
jgi:site-specific recombinase XerD